MPSGQLNSLYVDPATGGTILPGMIVDDDFSVDRLSSYLPFSRVTQTQDKSGASVAFGKLRRTGAVDMGLRNQRPFTEARMMVGMTVGPAGTIAEFYPKVIDANNFLLVQVYAGHAVVYQCFGGVYLLLNVDGDLGAPSGGLNYWYVTRLSYNGFSTSFVIEAYSVGQPANLGFPVEFRRGFNVPLAFSQTSGYAGLGLLLNPPVDCQFLEWTVVDATNRQNF